MKIRILLVAVFFCPVLLNAQYEQKISFDLAVGGFKTFGKKFTEYTGPLQMANYRPGLSIKAGIQFKPGEHFSLAAGFGIMGTNKWNYRTPDRDNWLYWTIDDTITGIVLEEGEDYLDFRNFSISLTPKYYLQPGEKWNPYIFAGVNMNWTSAWFENNLFAAQKARGLLPPEVTEPYNDNLEESSGIGLNPGFGVEYSPGDRLHFFMETNYCFIKLNKNNFKDPARVENFNAFMIQAGCRLYFIKSKEL